MTYQARYTTNPNKAKIPSILHRSWYLTIKENKGPVVHASPQTNEAIWSALLANWASIGLRPVTSCTPLMSSRCELANKRAKERAATKRLKMMREEEEESKSHGEGPIKNREAKKRSSPRRNSCRLSRPM